MKKILPLTFLLTYKMNGYMEKEKKLMFQMRTSYGFRCNLLVRRHETVFVNENVFKVNEQNYCKH